MLEKTHRIVGNNSLKHNSTIHKIQKQISNDNT